MVKLPISFLILLLVLTAGISLKISSKNNTETFQYTRSYTQAICDSWNFCQDYEIFCKNKKVVKISGITGSAVQFSENWVDKREKTDIGC